MYELIVSCFEFTVFKPETPNWKHQTPNYLFNLETQLDQQFFQ